MRILTTIQGGLFVYVFANWIKFAVFERKSNINIFSYQQQTSYYQPLVLTFANDTEILNQKTHGAQRIQLILKIRESR